MLSARDFYRLQKLSSQGKVKNSEEGISLVKKLNKSLDTLDAPCDGNAISKSLTSETSNQLHDKSNAKKRRRVKKRKSSVNNESCVKDVNCSNRTQDLESSLNTTYITDDSDQEFGKLHTKKQKCDLKQGSPSKAVAEINHKLSPKNNVPDASLRPETLSLSSKQNINSLNPLKQGERLLKEMLGPITVEEFIRARYQKSPLHVERSSSKCGEWLNFSFIKKLLEKEFLFFGQHVDLIEGKTLQNGIVNPPGRAFAGTVWEHYFQRKVLRFNNLQTFSKRLRFRIDLLQEYFGCNFTITAYLLPSKSTGLLSNQLDYDLFILQQEGSQNFQITSNDKAMNFKGQNKRVMSVKLKPGDLLYIPKGFTYTISHDNNTQHTLHLCISFDEKYNWGDYLSELLPIMIKNAVENDPEFHKPLPLNAFKYLGVFFNKNEANKHAIELEKEFRLQTIQLLKRLIHKIEQRQTFTIQKSKSTNQSIEEETRRLSSATTTTTAATTATTTTTSSKEIESVRPPQQQSQQPNPYDNLFIQTIDPLHLAIDKIMLKIMRERCAPELSEDELIRSNLTQSNDKSNPLTIHSRIRLVRSTAIRLILTYFEKNDPTITAATTVMNGNDDDSHPSSQRQEQQQQQHSMIPSFMVYHCLNNQSNHSDMNANVGIGFHKKFLIALTHLIHKYPVFIPVHGLPLEKHTDCLNVALTFYKLGFIITEHHKQHQIDDDDEVQTIEGEEEQSGENNVVLTKIDKIPKHSTALMKNTEVGRRGNCVVVISLDNNHKTQDDDCRLIDEDNITDDDDAADDCIITGKIEKSK
ncbi:unnamed protein product [Schistosoma turkestanicum]|nr:unnamed protein product [Schistosoma turkestanicum]